MITATELQKYIIELAFLEHSEAPLVSCYLNAGPACRRFLEDRMAVLEAEFPPEQRVHLRNALLKIDSYLAVGLDSSSRSIAMFSRAGSRQFFLALPFAVTLTQSVGAGALPEIYRLMEIQRKYEPFLVAIWNPAALRILKIDLGRAVSETFSKGSLTARARLLQHAISAGGRLPVILVGHDHDTAALAAALPRQASTAIVGTTVCEPHARSTEITRAAFSALRRFRERQSVTAAAVIAARWEPTGPAFAGPVNALVSIQTGSAEAVWLAQDSRPEAALICSGCSKVEWALLRPTLCRNCGDNKSLRPTDSREQLVRAAVQAGCPVHILWNPGVFGAVGGVVCMVRTAAEAEKVRKVA